MSKMYDNITGRSPIATDDLGYIGTGNKASDILNNGTTDYNDLNNKPTINNVELQGDLTSNDLGLQPELTEAQTNAVNSGITAALTEQITTNQNNISNIQTTLASYHKASGADIYFQEDEPTGVIPNGSYWISKTGIKIHGDNIYNATVEQGSFDSTNGSEISSPNRVRTTFDSKAIAGNYTVSATGVDYVVIYAYTTNSIGDWSSVDSVVSWQALPYTFTTTSDLYLRFAFRREDNANITPANISDMILRANTWHS